MIVHRLSVSGFKIIGDALSLEFPEQGRIGIFGANESGKSTFLESIAFALYGLKRRGTASEQRENIISWGKNRTKLELEFSSGENRYLLQRDVNVKGGHTARLWRIANGEKAGLETNLTRIQEKIEEITGMDRDSFSKLIYIGQNDLDALKDMIKNKREQLVNKVMGVEVFDTATAKVNEELTQIRRNLDTKENEFTYIKRDKEEYERQIVAKRELEKAKTELEKESDKQKKLLQDAETKAKKYDWLANKKSKEYLRGQMLENIQNLNKRINELDGKRKEKKDLEIELKKYEGTEETLTALKGIKSLRIESDQKNSVKEEKERKLNEISPQILKQQSFLAENEENYQRLLTYFREYSEFEGQQKRNREELQQFEEQKNAELQKHRISEKDMTLLTINLPKIKNRQLLLSIILISVGIILISVSSILNYILLAAGIALLAAGAVSFRRYQRFENLANLGMNIQSLIKSAEQKKSRIEELNHDFEELIIKNGFRSYAEIENKLDSISSALKSKLHMESFDALRAVLERNKEDESHLRKDIEKLEQSIASLKDQIEMLSLGIESPPNIDKGIDECEKKSKIKAGLNGKLDNVNANIQTIEGEKPQEMLNIINARLAEINIDLEGLEKTKPENVDAIEFSEQEHDGVKNDLKQIRNGYNELSQELVRKIQGLEDVEKTIERVKSGYERYDGLLKQISEMKDRIELYERIIFEMKETSKEMRNRVLPHARYIINQILPTLTDGRYSDLEISEDLQFKVHSQEAGDYKERDVFSGGTQDQFLIALRLAFTQSILDSRIRADYYCLLMDECISSSDEIRKQAIFEVLEAMKESFRQIFIVAHEDISNFVDHHLVLGRNTNSYCEVKSKSW